MIKTRSYYSIDDVEIDRTQPHWAILRDDEGSRLFSFPADMSDTHIRQALLFAAQTYHQGQELGSEARAIQIRAALGVPHPELAETD